MMDRRRSDGPIHDSHWAKERYGKKKKVRIETDECMDGWMDGWMDELINGRINA